jgi:hypothetical protein
MDSSQWGKGLVALGFVLALLGGLVWLSGKIPFVGRLPGDFRVERPHFAFYIPLTSCLLLSGVVSLVFWIFSKIKHP